MKVWFVESGCCSEMSHEHHGVFSTREKAEGYIKSHSLHLRKDLYEFKLDEGNYI